MIQPNRIIMTVAFAAACAALVTACSSDVLRPEVDVTRTAAISMPASALMVSPDMTVEGSDAEPAIEIRPGDDAGSGAAVDVGEAALSRPDISTLPPAPVEPRGQYAYAVPPPQAPMSAPSAMPQSEMECRRQLKRIGATFTDLPRIRQGQCGIDYPVRLSGLSGGVEVKPAATLNCQMALTFARWSRNELTPAARTRYLSGVKTIHQASSYSCRKIARSSSMSEHSKGNAIDIARIVLKNGKEIGIRKPGWFSFRERGLLNNVRGEACSYFTTVLGPGYNYDHRDHFHLDLAPRRNGRVACH